MNYRHFLTNRGRALLLAVTIGLAFMALFHLTFLSVTGYLGKNAEGMDYLRQSVVISLPFVVLALRRASMRLWLIVGAISVAVYGYYLFDEIRCALEYGRTASKWGRNLMVLGPFVMIAIGYFGTRHRKIIEAA